MEERQLIEGCVRGEQWAQKMMYELYAPTMMSVCQRYVCNRETARDLLHDGFIRLFSKMEAYSGKGLFVGWMRRIFVTTALEHLRRNDIMRYSLELTNIDVQYEDTDVTAFEHLSADDLLECVARLPDQYRTVFNMHAIEEYTFVEIARELEINENTLRTHYARARQLLQKMVMERVSSLQIAGV